jgi:hypothetical protein
VRGIRGRHTLSRGRALDHDPLWIFLAAFAVLLPAGKTTITVAAARVISTIVGMLVLSALGLIGALVPSVVTPASTPECTIRATS